MRIPIHDGLLQFFDVDHGACALLTLPTALGMKRVLVDCGHNTAYDGAPWYPGAHLQFDGINHIDLLVITNLDEDHVSGAPDMVQRNITVGCILSNPTVPPEAIHYLKSEDGMGNGIKVIANSLEDRRTRNVEQKPPQIPGLALSWFWNPWPHWDTENNLSLVTHLSIHGINFLFTGDIERDGFENLLAYAPFAQLVPDIDVLVAPHHGRESGRCSALFDTYGCNPKLVLISDCAKKFQSQETVVFYAERARGVSGFRGASARYVLTTRSDGHFHFTFRDGVCHVA